MTLRIDSEIGKLRSVLVHQPGHEIDRMVPSMMQNLLFDDILHGARAREEHRRFQQILRFVAEDVIEVQDLLEEVFQDADRKGPALTELAAALALSPELFEHLSALPPEKLAAGLIEGIERPAPAISESIDSLFVLPPIPNYFFQRDPAMVVGDRVIRASMATPARLREPLLNGIVFAHHPRFAREDGGTFWFREFSAEYGRPVSYARMRPTIEGGDLLVLREDVLAIGYSERTEKTTIERLAEALKRVSKAHALQYRDGLVIALAALIPMRRRTLVALRIGKHLVKNGDLWELVIPAEDTKTRRPLDYPISKE